MRVSATVLLTFVLGVGCGNKDAAEAPGEATQGGESVYTGQCVPSADHHEVTEYDTSGDDQPDVRKLFVRIEDGNLSRVVLICREADLNGDGIKDVVRMYNEEGRPKLEEADRDLDGQMDEITHFAAGRIILQEIDSNGNGQVDTKIYYEDGQPVRGERDLAGRSTQDKWQPDRWEYYEDGRTTRIGSDVDGDGKVDRWDRDEERIRKSALAQEDANEESAN